MIEIYIFIDKELVSHVTIPKEKHGQHAVFLLSMPLCCQCKNTKSCNPFQSTMRKEKFVKKCLL